MERIRKMNEKIITIKSLASFLKIINSLDPNEYYYRGEEEKFKSGIIARLIDQEQAQLHIKPHFLIINN